MQATKFGPAGYDYQYLASLFIILFFSNEQRVEEIYIDKLDSEDLMLSIIDNVSGKKDIVEFEFKNRISGFDKDYFIKCITKFTASRDDEYILSKLEKGQTQRFYLFTSARAGQYSEDYLVIANKTTLLKPSGKRTKKIIREFRDSIIGKKRSGNARDNFVVDHLNSLSDDQVESLLQSLIIVDQFNEEYLFQRIADLLSLRGIVPSAHDIIIQKLIEIIKNSRVSGNNIVELINKLLEASRTRPPMLNSFYLNVGDEDALLNELQQNKMLLLTGTTLCGKTQRAYRLIEMLLAKWPSINYQPAMDIRTAEQFLFDNATEGRICYLEDPLGQNIGDVGKSFYKQLESLVRNLPINRERYLICTSTSEIVNALQESSYLNNFHWNDLTVKDKGFLQAMWVKLIETYANDFPKNGKVIKQAIDVLQGKDILQPGQLSYLARNFEERELRTIEEVKHVANFRAQDITEIIMAKGNTAVQLMQILGIGASTQSGLKDNELSYLAGDDENYLPGINQFKTRSTGTSMFGTIAEDNYSIPQYRETETGIDFYENIISEFIDLGYIGYSSEGYLFSHPIYQEAARNLLSGKNPIRFKMTVKYARILIGCLNPEVALQAVKNLYLLVSNATNNLQRLAVIELAEIGAQSTFVTVRDNAILFLVNQYEHLDSQQQENLKDHFEHRLSFGTGNYFWQDGIAFIPDTEHLTKAWNSYDEYLFAKDALASWKEYLETKPALNSQQSFQLLKSLIRATRGGKRRITYDISELKYFLLFDEAFIRERAAFLIAASVTDDTLGELKEIYFENDPYVKFQLIKGLFRSWPYIKDEDKRQKLLNFMLEAFDEPFVVLSAIPLFTQFAAGHSSAAFDWRYDIESSAKKEMWFLWGELMVVLFKHLPSSFHINSGRFQSTLSEAKIPIVAKVKIIEAYLDWLSLHHKDSAYYSIFSDLMLFFFEENFEKIPKTNRLELSKRFLSGSTSIVQANACSLFITNWEILSNKEKEFLIRELPNLPQVVKTVAFTTLNAPSEVQIAATGYSIRDLDTDGIIRILPKALIFQAITAIYHYYPTKDINYRDTVGWERILKYFIDKPSEEGFGLAIKVFLDDILKWHNSRQELWGNSNEVFQTIINSNESNAFITIFNILLEFLVEQKGEKALPYLDILYKSSPKDLQKLYAERLCANLEALSYEKNLSLVGSYLSQSCLNETLSIDDMVLTMLNPKFYNGEEGESYKAFAKITILFMQKRKLRLHHVILVFRNWAQEKPHLFEPGQLKEIEEYLTYFHDTVSEQRREKRKENELIFEKYLDFLEGADI